jgi:hypothetical protein
VDHPLSSLKKRKPERLTSDWGLNRLPIGSFTKQMSSAPAPRFPIAGESLESPSRSRADAKPTIILFYKSLEPERLISLNSTEWRACRMK